MIKQHGLDNISSLILQDFNKDVLELATLPNLCANVLDTMSSLDLATISKDSSYQFNADLHAEMELTESDKTKLIEWTKDKVHFIFGPWSSLSGTMTSIIPSVSQFDLILASETLYDAEYYDEFHDTITNLLSSQGVAYGSSLSLRFNHFY